MDAKVPFFCTLVSAIVTLASGAMMALMSFVVSSMMSAFPRAPGIPFLSLFVWMGLSGVLGGALLLVAALRMRAHGSRAGATLAIVGGCVALLSGNVLGATGGIVGGVLAKDEPASAPVTGQAPSARGP